MLPLADPSDSRVTGWLDAMKNRYQLREWRPIVVDMAEPGAKPRTEHYDIYEFVPIDLVRHELAIASAAMNQCGNLARGRSSHVGAVCNRQNTVEWPVACAIQSSRFSHPWFSHPEGPR